MAATALTVAHAGAVAFDVAAASAVTVAIAAAARPRSRAYVLGGGVALLVAAAPPLHDLAEQNVAWHMVQHLVLTLAAASLLGLALADVVARGPRMARPLRRALLARWSPPLAAAVHVVVLAVWHFPGPYDAAVASSLVHAIEHATLLATALWFWTSIAYHARRRAAPLAALGLFVVATGCAFVGATLMFVGRRLYAPDGDLADQQIAGALMSTAGGFVTGAVAMTILVQLVARAEQPARAPRRATRASALVPIVILPTAALLAVLVDTSRSTAMHQVTSPPGDEVVERGAFLYRRDCAWCHGVRGEGTERVIGLQEVGPAGVDYVLATGRMPITSPDERIQRRTPQYTQDDIDALVAYTADAIGGPPLPLVDVETANLPRGGELYRRHCAACHGAEGIGGALAFGELTPHVLDATPEQVAQVIIVGPGSMPAFGAALSDEDIDAVAAYVQLLQDPPSRGLALPGGRVTEGLFAWLVGLGVLLVAARAIGTRA